MTRRRGCRAQKPVVTLSDRTRELLALPFAVPEGNDRLSGCATARQTPVQIFPQFLAPRALRALFKGSAFPARGSYRHVALLRPQRLGAHVPHAVFE